jgi:hypothetical protein
VWTSSAVTTLGGVGSEAPMQYGTGNVRMLALDSMTRAYCYTLYNVRYVPQSRVWSMATEPERLRDIHMRTEPHSLTSIDTGWYTMTVVDEIGCISVDSFHINDDNALDLTDICLQHLPLF